MSTICKSPRLQMVFRKVVEGKIGLCEANLSPSAKLAYIVAVNAEYISFGHNFGSEHNLIRMVSFAILGYDSTVNEIYSRMKLYDLYNSIENKSRSQCKKYILLPRRLRDWKREDHTSLFARIKFKTNKNRSSIWDAIDRQTADMERSLKVQSARSIRLRPSLPNSTNVKHTLDDVRAYLKQHYGDRYILLSTRYENNSKSLDFYCAKHERKFHCSYRNLTLGLVCSDCRKESGKTTTTILSETYDPAKKAVRHSKEKFVADMLRVHGDAYDYTDTVYINKRTPVTIVCKKCGKKITQRPDELKRRCVCSCNMDQFLDINSIEIFNDPHNKLMRFVSRFRKVHGARYLYPEQDFDSGKMINIVCPFHGPFSMRPYTHLSGSACPSCDNGYSKGENAVKQELDHRGLLYIQQKAITPTNEGIQWGKIYADFYVPRYKAVIEFNGKQHYEPVERFGGHSAFEVQKLRDDIMRDCCSSLGYKYIEIRYDQMDLIREILSSAFSTPS